MDFPASDPVGQFLFFQGMARSRTAPVERPTPGTVPRANLDYPEEARAFFRELLAAAGIREEGYRFKALHRRGPACLRHLGVTSLEEASRRLAQRPELVESTLNVALLGVTEFFRDPVVFNQLRYFLRPRMRVWSAACSEGQELYSMALLLQEDGVLEGAELLGTDCRPGAIRRASEGRFTAAELGKLAPAYRERWFAPGREGFVAAEPLRSGLRWRRADLFKGAEPGPWDVILWRNMAIYLEPAEALPLWRGLCAELAPDGLLVTGKADHPPAGLPLERLAPCIYRRRATTA